jgi:hypothetical protein
MFSKTQKISSLYERCLQSKYYPILYVKKEEYNKLFEFLTKDLPYENWGVYEFFEDNKRIKVTLYGEYGMIIRLWFKGVQIFYIDINWNN